MTSFMPAPPPARPVDESSVTIDVAAAPAVSAPSSTTSTHTAKLAEDNRPTVSLSLAGKLSGLGGKVLGALTPRSARSSSSGTTPREPYEVVMTSCLVIDEDSRWPEADKNPGAAEQPQHEDSHREEDGRSENAEPSFRGSSRATGVIMEGATVVELTGMLNSSFAYHNSWGLQAGDVILSISGERFESTRPLADYILWGDGPDDPPKKRAYMLEVRRTITPPRYPKIARLKQMVFEDSAPATEAEMEDALSVHEMSYQHLLLQTEMHGHHQFGGNHQLIFGVGSF